MPVRAGGKGGTSGMKQRRTDMDERRKNVPFDPFHFERRAHRGEAVSIDETFRQIYDGNHWRSAESVSGEGAERAQTRQVETALPALLTDLNVEIMLDLPCGDFGWMRAVRLPVSLYLGADIVPELIAENQRQYGAPDRRFLRLDLTRDPLPAADLLFCRDCLVHLSFEDAAKAILRIRSSRISYLLTTTFPDCPENEDITTGDWRPLNLEAGPFHFPPPLRLVNEGCTEAGGLFRDKSLGLWRVADLPPVPSGGVP